MGRVMDDLFVALGIVKSEEVKEGGSPAASFIASVDEFISENLYDEGLNSIVSYKLALYRTFNKEVAGI